MKTRTEFKVLDLILEYRSSFVDIWEGLDKAAKNFKKQLVTALGAEQMEILLCQSYEHTNGRRDYRNCYWTRFIILKNSRLGIQMHRFRGLWYKRAVMEFTHTS